VKFRKQSANEKKRARKFFEENVRFWNSLALVADNPVLWNIQDHLDNLLCLVGVHGILIDTDADRWITFHEEILQAILDRNLALAQGLVRKSAADINEAILELGDEAFV
jgi:DNA-binding FadR family transcriptional regulator